MIPSTSRTLLPLLRPSVHQQVRYNSFSLRSLGGLFRRDKAQDEEPASATAPKAKEPETGKGLFDVAVEDSQVVGERQSKAASYHKSSTAHFKYSRRKLNDISRLIAGMGADEALLQLQMNDKKPASRLLSMLALARDHAVSKGMKRENLVVDIKGRGRYGVKHHPSSKLHVLLAEGKTKEEQKREKKREQWRASLRGLAESPVGVGKQRKLVNSEVGTWRW
ncbi:hypothetical protein MNV49_002298 [Pseudohyphozyma bogoriensis]|nr:hypothetical protein MNV49_002298 [Pseudohyphozyma bogoriensis]